MSFLNGIFEFSVSHYNPIFSAVLFLPFLGLAVFAVIVVAALIVVAVFVNKKHMESDYYRQTGKDIFDLAADKGSFGEYKIGDKLERVDGYKKIIYNCYLPKNNGETTEVDVIMIHEKGIYVIESKNYSGWIFGSEDHTNWTQVLRSGKYGSKKRQFYNPIKQNETHVRWIQKLLEPMNVDTTTYSCIVFGDSCKFKNITVTNRQQYALVHACQLFTMVQEHIKQSYSRLTPYQINAIYDKLFPLTQKSEAEKLQHIFDVSSHKSADQSYHNKTENNRYTSNTTFNANQNPKSVVADISGSNEKKCPKCGSAMVLRTAKKGENVGQKFWGCSGYPNCRYIEKV